MSRANPWPIFAAALISLVAFVWFAGPAVYFPLGRLEIRLFAIFVILIVVGSVSVLAFWRRRRRGARERHRPMEQGANSFDLVSSTTRYQHVNRVVGVVGILATTGVAILLVIRSSPTTEQSLFVVLPFAWMASCLAFILSGLTRAPIFAALMNGVAISILTVSSAILYFEHQQHQELVAKSNDVMLKYRKTADVILAQKEVVDGDVFKIAPALDNIRSLPLGFENREEQLARAQRFGLGNLTGLRIASVSAYRSALERLLLPRTMWHVEEVLVKNRDVPGVVHQALDVYLMLGARIPMDGERLRAWIKREWKIKYPGAGNAVVLDRLMEHFDVLIQRPISDVAFKDQLVRETLTAIEKMPVAHVVYGLLKARAEAAAHAPWIASKSGGDDAASVFETRDGAVLSDVMVPGFFTKSGFIDGVSSKIEATINEVREIPWMIGRNADHEEVAARFTTVRRDVMALYVRDFIAAWDSQLARVNLRPISSPSDLAWLKILSRQNSPLLQMLRTIRDETALGDAVLADTPMGSAAQTIEAHFKPLHDYVVGNWAGVAPIDRLLMHIEDLAEALNDHSNGQLSDEAISNAKSALDGIAADESKTPGWVAGLTRQAVGSLKAMLDEPTSHDHKELLYNEVTVVCERIARDVFPFNPHSTDEVDLKDFARLFGPGGAMDSFFEQHLAPMVDRSGDTWRWTDNSSAQPDLSNATLRQFQRARQIRDAFFSSGRLEVTFTITPVNLSGEATSVRFTSDGQSLVYEHDEPRPMIMSWPGKTAGRVEVAFAPERPGQNRVLRQGTWALIRMMRLNAAQVQAGSVLAAFEVGGRSAQFEVQVPTSLNPFQLPALTEFSCPRGL